MDEITYHLSTDFYNFLVNIVFTIVVFCETLVRGLEEGIEEQTAAEKKIILCVL